MQIRNWSFFLLRLLIGALFMMAGLHKILGPVEDFHAAILAYDITPYNFALFLAWALPWIEVICAAALIAGFGTRWAGLGCSLMAATFLGAMALSYLKAGQLPEECGCFGGSFRLPIPLLIALDLGIVLVGGVIFRLKNHFLAIENRLTN